MIQRYRGDDTVEPSLGVISLGGLGYYGLDGELCKVVLGCISDSLVSYRLLPRGSFHTHV